MYEIFSKKNSQLSPGHFETNILFQVHNFILRLKYFNNFLSTDRYRIEHKNLTQNELKFQ